VNAEPIAKKVAEPSPARLTQIVILVPSGRSRAWTGRLAEACRLRFELPVKLVRIAGRPVDPIPGEACQRLVFGTAHSELAGWIDTARLDLADKLAWDRVLVVNATERDPRTLPAALSGAVVLSPVFHGRFAAEGLVRPLLRGETPHLAVVATVEGKTTLLQEARLAMPERAVIGRALHLAFGRTLTLLQSAVEHELAGRSVSHPYPPPAPEGEALGLQIWPRLAGAGASKLARRLRTPFVRDEWWCVGVRPLAAGCPPAALDLDPASFRMLESGPDRFYADPFLLRSHGATVLFFEDYDYHTNRGSISCVRVNRDGRLGPRANALTRPYHLSYPFVFVHDGTAYMIPESSENRTIELYEARGFPTDWRLRAVLMEDVDASDTTLHFDPGAELWWMFSAVAEPGGSSHDTLSIFWSQKLEGPWRPHAENPVKLDAAGARPAGPLLPWNGRLFRPAQDCAATYGGGLTWCELVELTPSTFREEVVARHRPGPGFDGVHTYGRAAGFEVVDFKRRRSRLSGRERRP
jgi:hypothetical protein